MISLWLSNVKMFKLDNSENFEIQSKFNKTDGDAGTFLAVIDFLFNEIIERLDLNTA